MIWLAACTFAPGTAFTRVDGLSLSTGFDPGARALGDGDVVSDLGSVWRLDTFATELSTIELQELRGAGGVTFDPANPPAGYSLCHSGHCHADDGALVDYSEIELELAGGSATLETIASWDLSRPVDWLQGLDEDLGEPMPADLPEVTVTRVLLSFDAVRVAGQLTPDGGDTEAFDLLLPSGQVSADVGLVVDRSAPEAVSFALTWTIDGTLFDGVQAPFDAAGPEALVTENLLLNLATIAVVEE